MDYSKLNYPSLLDDTVTKTIAYSHNVFFTDELKNKKLKIDGSLTLLNDKAEIQAVSFLKQFVSERRVI
jgi:hypothetical protein